MKRFLIKFLFFSGLAMLITAASLYATQRTDVSFDVTELLGLEPKSLNVMIMGDTDDAALLRSEIANLADPEEWTIDTNVEDPAEADEVVFLLNSWDELRSSDMSGDMGRVFKTAERMAFDTVSVTVERPAFGKDMRFTFFNTAHYPTWGSTCYAVLYLHRVQREEGSSFLPPEGCPI